MRSHSCSCVAFAMASVTTCQCRKRKLRAFYIFKHWKSVTRRHGRNEFIATIRTTSQVNACWGCRSSNFCTAFVWRREHCMCSCSRKLLSVVHGCCAGNVAHKQIENAWKRQCEMARLFYHVLFMKCRLGGLWNTQTAERFLVSCQQQLRVGQYIGHQILLWKYTRQCLIFAEARQASIFLCTLVLGQLWSGQCVLCAV
jgi:hypothetical protein